MKTTIKRLIDKIGSKNIKIQFLNVCMASSMDTKKGTRVTFLTDEKTNNIVSDYGREALILWVDKKKLNKAFDEIKKEDKKTKNEKT